jgi:endonuclease III-like uncharacterized protein
MTHHTLTITLTDEQYQMLVAQTHYENWWLVNRTEGRVEPKSSSAIAALIVSATLTQMRNTKQLQFTAQFAEIDKAHQAMLESLDTCEDPGMRADIQATLELNDDAYRALDDEYKAFCGPTYKP